MEAMNLSSPIEKAPIELATPDTGEHFAFQTSARSGDGLFRFRWTLDAGRKGPPPHAHPDETESFEIISGTLRVWLGGEERVCRPGDVFAVPPGVVHSFLNEGPEPVVADVSLDGPRQEDLFVPLALLLDGRTKPTAGETLRNLVQVGETRAISTGYRAVDATFMGLVWLLKKLGVKGLGKAPAWDVS
jgi:quercetin dioxygenase-like cupin family protein